VLLDRAIHTRFRYASPRDGVKLAAHGNSPVHYAKGTPSHIAGPKTGHSASTACGCAVSGPISLSSRLYFSPFPHGTCSLSVAKKYLALGGGPPGFRPGSTCPAVLGTSASYAFIKPVPRRNRAGGSRDPGCAALAGCQHTTGLGLARPKAGARPRSLTATKGVEVSFLSCGY